MRTGTHTYIEIPLMSVSRSVKNRGSPDALANVLWLSSGESTHMNTLYQTHEVSE